MHCTICFVVWTPWSVWLHKCNLVFVFFLCIYICICIFLFNGQFEYICICICMCNSIWSLILDLKAVLCVFVFVFVLFCIYICTFCICTSFICICISICFYVELRLWSVWLLRWHWCQIWKQPQLMRWVPIEPRQTASHSSWIEFYENLSHILIKLKRSETITMQWSKSIWWDGFSVNRQTTLHSGLNDCEF